MHSSNPGQSRCARLTCNSRVRAVSGQTTFNRALRLPTVYSWVPWQSAQARATAEHSVWPQILLYWVFTIFGQLFLLNLLIAVVGAARASVALQASRVARFARAKVRCAPLSLPTLTTLSQPGLCASQIIIEKELEALFRSRVTERSSRWLQDRGGAPEGRTVAESDLLSRMTPRWLHVLVPVKPDMSKAAETTELSKIARLQAQLGRVERTLELGRKESVLR